MSNVDLAGTRWRKSSRSNGQTECVEVVSTLKAVRDSKNPTGAALSLDVTSMVAAIKAGALDR